jgi:hypothetical protein
MARARNIKPAFFKNELLAELHAFDRLLFIGLWCLADREGRIEDRHKRIKMELFPCDSYDVEHGLTELARCNFLRRYEANGIAVIELTSFMKHQTPHGSEKDSVLPSPDGSFTIHERTPSGHVIGAKRQNSAKLHENSSTSPVQAPVEPSACTGRAQCITALNPESRILNPDILNPEIEKTAQRKRRTQLAADFYPNETGVTAIEPTGLSMAVELEKFRNHHAAKGSVMADWQAAWRTWVGNAVKFSSSHRSTGRQAESFAERDERQARERWEEATGKRTRTVIDITPATELLERLQ